MYRYVFQVPKSGSENYQELIGPFLWEKFSMVELTEIMRQKEDRQFAVALNNLSNDCLTQDDIHLFQGRVVGPDLDFDQIPDIALHLFPRNLSVDHFNMTKLNSLKTDGAISVAIDTFPGNHPASLIAYTKEKLQSIRLTETQGLASSILLKTEARYMMTVNVITDDGLVNGATGMNRQIDFGTRSDTKEKVPLRVWLEFGDENVGTYQRDLFKAMIISRKIPPNWTPIEMIARRFQRGRGTSSIQVNYG